MLVLFDKLSSKILYLFDINGTLRDSNGMPYYPKGDGVLKDLNGKVYYVIIADSDDNTINTYVENDYVEEYLL